MSRTSRRARRNSPLRITPALELFGASKDLVMKNIGIFSALYLLPFIFLLDSWMVNTNTLHGRTHWQWLFRNKSAGWSGPFLPSYAWGYLLSFAIWGLAMLVLSFLVQIMSQAAQLEAARSRDIRFSRLWLATKTAGWRMAGLYVVVGLLVFIPLAILVSLIVKLKIFGLLFVWLIIPSLLVLKRYFLAPYVLLDQNTGIREAMDKSSELSRQNTGAVWGVIGVMFLIGLINILPVFGGLIAFMLGALYSVAPALRYQELRKLG